MQTVFYVGELAVFYLSAYWAIFIADHAKASFLASFSVFLVLLACLFYRPRLPHDLVRVFLNPAVPIMYLVCAVFGAFGGRLIDLTIFVPLFALTLVVGGLTKKLQRSKGGGQ